MDLLDLSVGLEQTSQFLPCRLKIQVADKNTFHVISLLALPIRLVVLAHVRDNR
jgi:hypothetical protein